MLENAYVCSGVGGLNKGDCFIQAWANLFETTYEQALQIAFRVGWKKGEGVGILNLLDFLGRSGNWRCILSSEHNLAKACAEMNKTVILAPLNLTVGELQQTSIFPRLRALVWINGHIFTVRDGKLYGEREAKNYASIENAKILGLFQIVT